MSQNNIYSIDNWTQNTQYYKNYIVNYNNMYYYSAFDQTSSTNFQTDLNNGQWNGWTYDRGQNIPYFSWKPSYKFSNDNKPRIKKIQFSDGYFQNVPEGINTIMLKYDLTFETRDIHEATAILHFLMIQNGVTSFIWLPPAPRSNFLRFKCEEWSDIQEYFNNYNIKATFIQSPV